MKRTMPVKQSEALQGTFATVIKVFYRRRKKHQRIERLSGGGKRVGSMSDA